MINQTNHLKVNQKYRGGNDIINNVSVANHYAYDFRGVHYDDIQSNKRNFLFFLTDYWYNVALKKI